ncbi:MAG: hypothetical protein HYZ34_07015, partial [Ignavibacteriae bacterium]|nr:hypothetical protein [Ignavibacteriota bacterium]
CEDPNGDDNVLWIGTDGGGLNRFDKLSGELTHFTEKNGLPNNVVYGVLSDTMGNLWMSTNKGLCKYSTRGAVSADGQGSAFGGNPSSGSIRTYDVSDGLQSNEFNRKEYFKTKSGEIFFGGVNGYNHFYPEEISDNPIPPKIEFTDFKLSNRSVSYHDANSPLKQSIGETKSIVLDYSQNMFTLEFSALDFSTSQKNQYAYMLNGFDEHWNYAGTLRSATYTNIAPGEYTFRVKASNSDGVWNEQGASMEIIILPPFWMTWWFRGIGILLFLTAGPTISFRRVKQLQREQQQQEEFSRKLIERQELERKRIASELHDGVGQDLLVVKNKLLLAIDTVEQGTMDVQQLNDAAQFASQAIEEVRSISHNLRPSNLDQLGLTMAIETAVESVATSSTIRFSLNIENIDGLVTPENEINVYRIVQESLNNVVKHSQATEAGVEVRRELDSVLINVQDNGRGFRMNVEGLNTPKERFGLSGMKERAKALSGSLTIQQRESGGTIVQLSVPIQLTTKND